MSYNGVGLSTARGSGTNGHITKNRSTIRHRENFDKPADFKDSSTRAPDAGILEHERKRRVEVKCLELQVSLEDDGVEESIIEEKVSELRKGLLSASAAAAGTERERGSIKVHETHELGQAKEVANERMRKAMGINSSNHVEGKAFDREAQALDKVKRQEDRQRNEMERKERAVEMDLSRERQAKERESGKAKKEEELKRSKAAAAEVSRARREAEAKQSEKERDSGINKLDAELLQGRTGRVVEPRGGDKADEDESRPVQKRSRSRSTSSSPRNRRRDSRDDYRRSSPRQRYDSRSPRRRSPSPRRRGRSPTRSISRSRSPDSRSRSRSRSYSRSRSRSPPRQRARRDSPEFRRRSPSPVGRGNERQPAGRGRSADSRDRSMSMSMSRSPER